MAETPDLIALNRVRAGKADEFEQWLTDVVIPAASGPDFSGRRWEALRAGQSAFVFLFYGGEPDDWDLEAILTRAYDADRAKAELTTMQELLEGDQEAWVVTPVGADRHD